jgi:hypothetical protein
MSKMKVRTSTFWEVWESRSANSANGMGRTSKEDFRDRRDAEEFAPEIGYEWVKQLVIAIDEYGSLDEHTFYRERFYRVQPSVVTAHAQCCRCGQTETFENGVLAYDWKFEHELMHGLLCVDAWETDLAYPGEMLPLRKRVNTADGSILVPIKDTAEPEPQKLLSIGDED